MSYETFDPTISQRSQRLDRLGVIAVLRAALVQFVEDRAFILGGALAFFTCLSLGPIMAIGVRVLGSASAELQRAFVEQMRDLMGEGGGQVMQMILDNVRDRPELGGVASLLSIVVLGLSATAAFAHLQTAMNMVWNVKPAPRSEIRHWFWKRLMSLVMIVTVGVLLLMSLVISTAIAFLSDSSRDILPGARLIWDVADAGVTIVIFTLLFSAVFKFLPDAKIAWRDVWVGATTTGCLLWAGKQVIGLYLGRSAIGSAYGAAGSLVVFLVWVYYSALLVFFGAEVTQVWARSRGRRIRPSDAGQTVDV